MLFFQYQKEHVRSMEKVLALVGFYIRYRTVNSCSYYISVVGLTTSLLYTHSFLFLSFITCVFKNIVITILILILDSGISHAATNYDMYLLYTCVPCSPPIRMSMSIDRKSNNILAHREPRHLWQIFLPEVVLSGKRKEKCMGHVYRREGKKIDQRGESPPTRTITARYGGRTS